MVIKHHKMQLREYLVLSPLRNAVERIFGILKAHFAILNMPHSFSLYTQAKLVVSLCVLHNLIHIECGGDDWFCE